MQWNEAMERFMDHCRNARGLAERTVAAYGSDVQDFILFVGMREGITRCDRVRITTYLIHLREVKLLKQTSVKRRVATMRVMFKWLKHEGHLASNPFDGWELQIPLPKRLPRALTVTEVQALYRSPSCRMGQGEPEHAEDAQQAAYDCLLIRLVLDLLYTTGMRVGELVTIRDDDVDVDEGVIKLFGKGSRERRVFLVDDEVKGLVRTYRQAREGIYRLAPHLFLLTYHGQPVTTQSIRNRLRQAAQAAGLTRPITPHMLRHTAATHLLESGVDIRYVQRLLGHQSIATTEIYTQVSDSALKITVCAANARGKIGGGMMNN